MAFGDIGDFLGATFKEIGHHPLQAAGAALGVPGYDPFFGGLFNNHKGGALLSPTGNFTSSAWDEMYKDNPNSTAGLNLFHGLNSVADVVAPAVAGGFASGAFGGGAAGSNGGAGGITGFFNGPAVYGDSGLTGGVSASGSGLGGIGADMGSFLGDAPTGLFSGLLPGGGMSGTSSGALGGGISGSAAGASPIGGASMGAQNFGALANFARQALMQQSQQRQQQPAAQNSTHFQSLAVPQAYLAPFQPARVIPTAQMYGERLANYGGF